jgi:hypothetical protein
MNLTIHLRAGAAITTAVTSLELDHDGRTVTTLELVGSPGADRIAFIDPTEIAAIIEHAEEAK